MQLDKIYLKVPPSICSVWFIDEPLPGFAIILVMSHRMPREFRSKDGVGEQAETPLKEGTAAKGELPWLCFFLIGLGYSVVGVLDYIQCGDLQQ